jgi:hypothetical protein
VRRKSKALVAALTLLVIIGVAEALADTAPTPTMQPVSTFSYTSAHLEGEVDPNGGPSITTWQFQFSSEGPEGPWAPGPEGHFEGIEAEENTGLPVEGDLSGLKPNTTYYSRLVASNEGGQSSAAVPSFTTPEVQAPSVTIEAVSSPTSSTAQLVGHINPNAPEAAPTSPEVEAGFRVSWHFQCSPVCPGAEGQLEADNAEHEVSAEATGLTPGSKYNVSLVAENAGTSASAGPQSFTTEAGAPLLSAVSFSDVTATAATLKATIDPSGAQTSYRFEYTDDADFQANGFTGATKVPVPDASIGSGPGPVAVSRAISGLDPATKYDFRVLATNTVDSAESGASSFKTYAASEKGAPGQFPGQGFLPDHRAWEMVSPPDKNGGEIPAVTSETYAAPDGNAAVFSSHNGFAGISGYALNAQYLAERTAAPGTNGWSTHAITPPLYAQNVTQETGGAFPYYKFFSADLTRGVFQVYGSLPGSPQPQQNPNNNLYLRTDLRQLGSGIYQLLSDAQRLTPLSPSLASVSTGVVGGSADLGTVVFDSRQNLTEETAGTSTKSYLSAGGAPSLISRVPQVGQASCDDAGLNSCEPISKSSVGIGDASFGGTLRRNPHAISTDGSRIFFMGFSGAGNGNVYMREDGIRTVQLNASEKEPPEAPQKAAFWDASTGVDATGSPVPIRAFFTTSEQLVDEDEDGSPDLYMWSQQADGEGHHLTLLSPGVGVESIAAVSGASDDGRYVYFIDRDGHLDLWRDGAISVVAELGTEDDYLNTQGTRYAIDVGPTSRVTPDGRHLLFMARGDSGLVGHGGYTGYDHGTCTLQNFFGEPCRELYIYDAEDGSLRCVSCNPTGAAASADAFVDHKEGTSLGSPHASHALSDDGRYVFFSSAEKLVPGDVNGVSDAYEYDTLTGKPHLISSGEDPRPSYFMDATPDGSDVFFTTAERLSGWDVDNAADLYDARIDGGLPEPAREAASCQGDSCQPSPPTLNDPTPASSGYVGAANQHFPRCPSGRHRVRRNGKARCVKRNSRQHHSKRHANANRRAGR